MNKVYKIALLFLVLIVQQEISSAALGRSGAKVVARAGQSFVRNSAASLLRASERSALPGQSFKRNFSQINFNNIQNDEEKAKRYERPFHLQGLSFMSDKEVEMSYFNHFWDMKKNLNNSEFGKKVNSLNLVEHEYYVKWCDDLKERRKLSFSKFEQIAEQMENWDATQIKKFTDSLSELELYFLKEWDKKTWIKVFAKSFAKYFVVTGVGTTIVYITYNQLAS